MVRHELKSEKSLEAKSKNL